MLSRHMKVATLEHFVLAKPYFERHGILLATHAGTPVAFTHAGFGPNATKSDTDRRDGVICTLQALPEWNKPEILRPLVEAAERYLVDRGATSVLAGPVSPWQCFYHGLDATGESAGIPESDTTVLELYQSMGYGVWANNVVVRKDLTAFRPPFDRQQRAMLRTHEVLVDLDTDLSDWWELCRFGPMPRCGFQLRERRSHTNHGRVFWWDQAFSGAALQSSVSFTNLEIPEAIRRQGFGTLLMNEAMKQLKKSGAFYATAQINATNEPALAFFRSLDFQETSRGVTLHKTLG